MKGLTTFGRWGRLASVFVLVTSTGVAVAQEKARALAKPVGSANRAPIYDKQADAKVQVEQATALAKRDNKRVLLMFGGDWCGWCHKLHNLFASNAEIRKTISYEYSLVMIELESANAVSLLEKCKAALSKEELRKGVGYPFLAVLDADGKIVAAQRTDPLEEGDHHDPRLVQDFLTRWAVAPRDAGLVVKEALSRAASDDKRVFLTFGAPWCGWCHKLDDWLAQQEVAAIIGRDFVVTKIDVDRMTGGSEVMQRYRSQDSKGIPWYTILDSHGKKLATADAPEGNIGYPFEPKEIAQFTALLQEQSQRIGASQIEQLRKSLDDAALRIRNQSKP